MQPPGVQGDGHRRPGLENDHAPIRLQIDGELRSTATDEQNRPSLTTSERPTWPACLLFRGGVALEVGLVDVAGPQLAAAMTDWPRDQRADCRSGKGDAREPGAELGLEQPGMIVLVSGRPVACW